MSNSPFPDLGREIQSLLDIYAHSRPELDKVRSELLPIIAAPRISLATYEALLTSSIVPDLATLRLVVDRLIVEHGEEGIPILLNAMCFPQSVLHQDSADKSYDVPEPLFTKIHGLLPSISVQQHSRAMLLRWEQQFLEEVLRTLLRYEDSVVEPIIAELLDKSREVDPDLTRDPDSTIGPVLVDALVRHHPELANRRDLAESEVRSMLKRLPSLQFRVATLHAHAGTVQINVESNLTFEGEVQIDVTQSIQPTPVNHIPVGELLTLLTLYAASMPHEVVPERLYWVDSYTTDFGRRAFFTYLRLNQTEAFLRRLLKVHNTISEIKHIPSAVLHILALDAMDGTPRSIAQTHHWLLPKVSTRASLISTIEWIEELLADCDGEEYRPGDNQPNFWLLAIALKNLDVLTDRHEWETMDRSCITRLRGLQYHLERLFPQYNIRVWKDVFDNGRSNSAFILDNSWPYPRFGIGHPSQIVGRLAQWAANRL